MVQKDSKPLVADRACFDDLNLIYVLPLLLILVLPNAFAQESRSFNIPENSIQTFEIPLERGEEIVYSIFLQGDDTVKFSVDTPSQTLNFGEIDEFFDSSVVADSDGLYKFIFDNSISLDESKQLDFEFTITKVQFDVYIDEFPNSGIDVMKVIKDSFDFWKERYTNMEFNFVDTPQQANLNIQFVKDFGTEHIGYAMGSDYMEVGLGDNGCRDRWQPYSEKHVTHIVKHELGHILGLEHSEDPNNIMFSVSQGREYGVVDEEFVFSDSYGQFIPICSQKQITAIDFEIDSEDDIHGFDVFVVPSLDDFTKWQSGDEFRYYFHGDCFAADFLKFFGECHGLTHGSGLMIVTKGEQSNSLTNINVKVQEIDSDIDYPQTTALLSRDEIHNVISKSIEPDKKSENEKLRDKIIELKKENRQLKNQIDKMTEEFSSMIVQLNDWFREQLKS